MKEEKEETQAHYHWTSTTHFSVHSPETLLYVSFIAFMDYTILG